LAQDWRTGTQVPFDGKYPSLHRVHQKLRLVVQVTQLAGHPAAAAPASWKGGIGKGSKAVKLRGMNFPTSGFMRPLTSHKQQ
jgi:hypothetical protein